MPGFAADPLNPQPASSPAGDPLAVPSDGGPHILAMWPWLLALVAAIGAAFWYFRRQRSGGGYAFAGAGGDVSAFDLSPQPEAPVRPAAPRPAPAPAPRAAAPAPASTKPVSVPSPAPTPPVVSKGIVSTRLRPWIDIEFVPDRVEMGNDQAIVHFGIEVFNSGSAPARDLLVEAVLFNAGGDQDEAIGRFFAKRAAEGERIPMIAPLQRMAFQSAVSVPRDQMRIFEGGGRKVWVPLIGFNAFYRWGGGEGQTSASYLLGRDASGEKMSPFRTDIGPRTFRGLGAREHTLKVRN